jgi:hypothetical protein
LANTVPRKLDPLPLPAPSLRDLDLPTISSVRSFVRIHRLQHDPAFWGRTSLNRFDAPNRDYGVLYAAEHFQGAFIETFGDLLPRTVSVSALEARGVATVAAHRELRLVDLAETGLSQLGLDARICTDDHALSQAWSHALWAHPSGLDGIWYAARHDAGQRSVALFDRVASAVSVTAVSGLMDSPQDVVTARAIDTYGFSLLP